MSPVPRRLLLSWKSTSEDEARCCPFRGGNRMKLRMTTVLVRHMDAMEGLFDVNGNMHTNGLYI